MIALRAKRAIPSTTTVAASLLSVLFPCFPWFQILFPRGADPYRPPCRCCRRRRGSPGGAGWKTTTLR